MFQSIITEIKSKISPLLKYKYISKIRGVPLPDITGEKAQSFIAQNICTDKKLIARVGETEGRAVAFFLKHRFICSSKKTYPDLIKHRLKNLAGFFPCSDNEIDNLCKLYLDSILNIDIYAAWTKHDRHFIPRNVPICKIYDLDPFFSRQKWSLALNKRRVTIVSPFKKSILSQYEKRNLLFDIPTLPTMQLTVVKSPMTHCEQNTDNQNWFLNLCELKTQVKDSNPEIVVIGAGAYGLPLGAYVKKIGASAIVLGGATQLLFGIKGNRWEKDNKYNKLFNEHWCKPTQDERPIGYKSFEINGGAYW